MSITSARDSFIAFRNLKSVMMIIYENLKVQRWHDKYVYIYKKLKKKQIEKEMIRIGIANGEKRTARRDTECMYHGTSLFR